MVGSRRWSHDEAYEVLVGYAFGTVPLRWQRASGHPGALPARPTRARWAYRTYDCMPPAPGPDLTGVDLLVADGLNGQMRAPTVAGLLAVADDVSQCLRAIPDGTRFWELDLADVQRPGPDSSPSWHLHRAWSLLMGTPLVNVAVTHKTLHHKRPDVFPLLDRRTRASLPSGKAWERIHRDLNAAADHFAALEERFAAHAHEEGGVALNRLRLHDILLWCHATGQASAARAAGRNWVSE